MKKVVKFYVGVKDMILSNYPQFFFFLTIILKFCLCLMNSYLKIKRENFWKYVTESLCLSEKFENIHTKMEKIRKKKKERKRNLIPVDANDKGIL